MLFYSFLPFLVPFFPKITTSSEIDEYFETTNCTATAIDENEINVEKNASYSNDGNPTKENTKNLEPKKKYNFEDINYLQCTIVFNDIINKWNSPIENNTETGSNDLDNHHMQWNSHEIKRLREVIMQFELVLRQSAMMFATEIQEMGFRFDYNILFNVFYNQMGTIVTSIIYFMDISVDDTDIINNLIDEFTRYNISFRDQHLWNLWNLIVTDPQSQLKDIERALIEMTDFYRKETICLLKKIPTQ